MEKDSKKIAFRAYKLPFLTDDYRNWIEDCSLNGEYIFIFVNILSMFAREIPHEVVNLIVFLWLGPFRIDNELEVSGVWQKDVNKWLDWWLRTPQQQLLNPLPVLADPSKGDIEPHNRVHDTGICFYFSQLIGNNKYNFNRYDGCINIGISIPSSYDIQHIKDCYIEFNGQRTKTSYIFEEEYRINVEDNVPNPKYYYNPKFATIPLRDLGFVRKSIIIDTYNGKPPPSYIMLLDVKTIHPSPEAYIINFGDKIHEILVSCGTMAYRYV